MTEKKKDILELVNVAPIAFAYICCTTLVDSFRSVEDIRNTVIRYENRQCQLWTIKGKGFLILSFHQADGHRWLEVEQGVGRQFYTRPGIDLLIKLAQNAKCKSVVCEAYKPGVIRLLERLGFVSTDEHLNKFTLKIG